MARVMLLIRVDQNLQKVNSTVDENDSENINKKANFMLDTDDAHFPDAQLLLS